MELDFGLYLTALGVALVFLTLLAVAAFSELIRKVFPTKVVEEEGKAELVKVAATAAVLAFMESEGGSSSRRIESGESRWEAAAKSEVMERLDRSR
ncbi:MAG: hypothetical protein JSV18_00310 [Candidatus Bathyarchaeota archaeon]|nr:MAG: hypothetical protein JSV18_00310 [Candidatus Bathyarchaeota archaeon]